MQGIENSNRAHPAKNHPSENSRRPGTAGHPGKHLGQFKKSGIEPNESSQQLIEQQINSLKGNPQSTTGQQQESSVLDITAAHMNDMSDAFADQISFTSKMHSISTGLF